MFKKAKKKLYNDNLAQIGDIVTANNGKQYKIIGFEPIPNINNYRNAVTEEGFVLYQNRNGFTFVDIDSFFSKEV